MLPSPSGPVAINVSVQASLIAPGLTDASVARNIWNRTEARGVISSGALRVAGLGSHDSAFYRFSAGRPRPHAAAAAAAGTTNLYDRYRSRSQANATVAAAAAALAACRRVHGTGGGAAACESLTSCEQRCTAAGHCCVGTTSGYQHPSCAQGCIVATGTKTRAACNAVCAAADGKCTWTFNSSQVCARRAAWGR